MSNKARQAEQATTPTDDRFQRHTVRTVQFNTRVTPEWDQRLREIAKREGLLLVEVLERALETYPAPDRKSSYRDR